MTRECLKERVMIIMANEDYEFQDEQENECTDQEKGIKYLDVGELLVTRTLLSVLVIMRR